MSPEETITGWKYEFSRRVYDFSARSSIMGILNVTPDSFSDGGRYLSVENAVARGLAMAEEGADFLDVGGESSRPGSDPVPAAEELRRILPVIEGLAGKVAIPISVDTWKAEVARRALEAGASIINDITAMTGDPEMIQVAAEYAEGIVLMHMKGTPQTMQKDPRYNDVVTEVKDFLARRAAEAKRAGIRQIFVDPGIGFGKSAKHNLELLRRLKDLCDIGYPVLVGPSRKSFIGAVLNLPPEDRLEGTAGAVAVSIMNGAAVVRVHDVRAMVRVARIVDAIRHHG
ncbi:MAG: dihydropteroate synthase [Bacteroidia bacterium]|nr:MAG: dihydropteroate synthase [Bacteroidia bacterium]